MDLTPQQFSSPTSRKKHAAHDSFTLLQSQVQPFVTTSSSSTFPITTTSPTATSPPFNGIRRRSVRLAATPQLAKSDDGNDHVKIENFDHVPAPTPAPAPVLLKKKRKRRNKETPISGISSSGDGSSRSSSRSSSSATLLKKKKRKTGKKKKKTIIKKELDNSLSTASPSSPKRTTVAPKFIICSSDVAQISPENPWIDLQVSPAELRPSATLTTGQCFNFVVVQVQQSDTDEGNDDDENTNKIKEINNNGKGRTKKSNSKKSAWGTHNATEWVGPIQNMVLSIKETKSTTFFRVLHDGNRQGENIINYNNTSDFLKNYFQLETPLEPLYEEWSKNDIRLAKIAPCIPGVRIIRQDPVECLFSFLCSSNNNIPRITKMLASFRETYGQKLIDLPTRRVIEEATTTKTKAKTEMTIKTDDSSSETTMSIYSFPTLEEIQYATEQDLRDMGLGYRAKYVIQTRDLLIKNGGRDYLLNLRDDSKLTSDNDSSTITSTDKVQEELLQYTGIGRKVADCIALFSLDQKEAIPVDVHVQHIASRDYDPSVLGEAKSLTPKIYKKVGDLFRDRFTYAGWAHSLLFVAELPSFRDVLPEDVASEMDTWREAEMAKKASDKETKKKKKEIDAKA